MWATEVGKYGVLFLLFIAYKIGMEEWLVFALFATLFRLSFGLGPVVLASVFLLNRLFNPDQKKIAKACPPLAGGLGKQLVPLSEGVGGGKNVSPFGGGWGTSCLLFSVLSKRETKAFQMESVFPPPHPLQRGTSCLLLSVLSTRETKAFQMESVFPPPHPLQRGTDYHFLNYLHWR